MLATSSVGLYNSAYEHDACGVASGCRYPWSAQPGDRRPRDHRSAEPRAPRAAGAEPNSGDGAGIAIGIPTSSCVRSVANGRLRPAEEGSCATGMVFLPQSSAMPLTREAVEKIVEAEGLTVLGWRDVPIDESSLGALARDAMPTFRQLFIGGASGMELERRAYVIRKRAEHELGTKGPGQDGPGRETVYFPSLSGKTFVYKGMLTTPQLESLLRRSAGRADGERAGIVHSRFSTNTFPSRPLAHLFRRIAHNGRDQHRHRQRKTGCVPASR